MKALNNLSTNEVLDPLVFLSVLLDNMTFGPLNTVVTAFGIVFF